MKTNEEIRLSEWAREVYSESPGIYEYLINMVQDPEFSVCICENYELGHKVWAIAANQHEGCWMSTKPSKAKAIKLCKEMGWKIDNINKGERLK